MEHVRRQNPGERFRDLRGRVTDQEQSNQIRRLSADKANSSRETSKPSHHLSVWQWLKLVFTASLISLAMTSALAAAFWFVS